MSTLTQVAHYPRRDRVGEGRPTRAGAASGVRTQLRAQLHSQVRQNLPAAFLPGDPDPSLVLRGWADWAARLLQSCSGGSAG